MSDTEVRLLSWDGLMDRHMDIINASVDVGLFSRHMDMTNGRVDFCQFSNTNGRTIMDQMYGDTWATIKRGIFLTAKPSNRQEGGWMDEFRFLFLVVTTV